MTYGVAHPVAQMYTGGTEPDTSEGRSQTGAGCESHDNDAVLGTNSIWRRASESSGLLATRGRFLTCVYH